MPIVHPTPSGSHIRLADGDNQAGARPASVRSTPTCELDSPTQRPSARPCKPVGRPSRVARSRRPSLRLPADPEAVLDQPLAAKRCSASARRKTYARQSVHGSRYNRPQQRRAGQRCPPAMARPCRGSDPRPGVSPRSEGETISAKLHRAPDRIFGEYRVARPRYIPGFAGTPARLYGGFRVSSSLSDLTPRLRLR